ncbi:MAG: DMT family transporter [candidate division Zixibacteria bacterium]
MKNNTRIRAGFGPAVLVIGVFFVSWASILIRMSESAPTTIAFFRMFFATIMVACAIPFYKAGWYSRKSDFWISTLSGFFLGMHFILWIASLMYTSISSSVVIVTTQPVFVAVLGYIFLKERVGKSGIIAVILALGGTYLIARGDLIIDSAHLKGDLLALGGAVSAGLYLFIGRFVRPRVNLIPYVVTVYGVSAVTILLLGLVSGTMYVPTGANEYWLFFLLALGPTILGHNLYNYALRHLPAFPVGMSTLGEPVLATIWAMIIFKEFPIDTTIIGGAIIIFSVALVMMRLRVRSRA